MLQQSPGLVLVAPGECYHSLGEADHRFTVWIIRRSKFLAFWKAAEFFKFLKALARNNNREWFHKNKPRYERFVLTPSLQFIKDAGKELRAVSPYLVADARPFGGSLFRIYRDMRFVKDRSTCKPNAVMAVLRRWSG